ncbi:aromatic acid exporter family protein [Pengzhenrongella sp.]|jgi:uncharacterized membrane protein YgaE (UPF0421/DUF939 family)|uniref:aromatic acid exporter family protein n=1 Tax=Pengzhenrongella sp. TaxID=2888820 RepID=UPI002F95EA14
MRSPALASLSWAHRGVRHVRVQLALKGAFAASAAWFVAARLLPDDIATYACYAPLGAVIAIHPTVHRSATEAARNVAGIVLGATIALLTDSVFGVNFLTVALVVVVGILVGGMRWLGSQGWVPTSALLTLVVGSYDKQNYVLAFAGLTLMGAVFAVVVNMILPALPLERSAHSLTHLRDTVACELDALADSYGPQVDAGERTERSSQRHLDQLLGEMRSAVRESGEAADANRRARNQRETLRDLHRQAQALEQFGFLVHYLGLLLDDHSSGGGSLGPTHQITLQTAQALRALAAAVRVVTAGRCDKEVTTTVADSVDNLCATLLAHPPADATSHSDLLITGSVVTALRRSLTVIRGGDEDEDDQHNPSPSVPPLASAQSRK